MTRLLQVLCQDDSGQDLAEYALLFALIAIVAIASLAVLGGGISDVLTGIGNELETGTA
jgi:Flp pilus assembly pilin Flp